MLQRITIAAVALATAIGTPLALRAAPLPTAPVPQESFDVGMLHVDRYGTGSQSIVLIPGLGSGPWAWYGTVGHFAPAFTVYTIRLAGFDGSKAPQQPPTFTAFADDFWQLLARNAIRSPIVVGHSMGGTLAFLLAEQHSDRLRAIVAVDGLPVFPTLAAKDAQDRNAIASAAADSYAELNPAQALAYETRFMSTIGTKDPTLVAPTAALEAASDPKTVAAWLHEVLTADLRPDLVKIRIPVLEIVPYDPQSTENSGYTLEQTTTYYRSLLAGTPMLRLETIAPARHFAMLDEPDRFYALLTTFFDSLQ